jgi:transposase
MRGIGIDVGAERHVVAIVDAAGAVLCRATPFAEDAAGYATLRGILEDPADTLVALEATGHYWQNLVSFLVSEGFAVALLNPVRTHRFAGEDLARAKTDAIDAVTIARFVVQKRPAPMRLADAATQELRELVRLRERWVEELGTAVRRLHRLVDLSFPEFPQHVATLDSALATTLLTAYPSAAAFRTAKLGALANLRYDGRHAVGRALATALVTAARTSVGAHHGEAYTLQVCTLCEDIARLTKRLRTLEAEIDRTLRTHTVGQLLTTIDGIGVQTAARLVAELGDPAEFRDAAALAAYVGVAPAIRQSGKRQTQHAAISPIGHARLRRALWMPTIVATQRNAWLGAFYRGLRARGKPAKVALIAAMRKLLAAIYSVAKHRRPFVPILAPTEPTS